MLETCNKIKHESSDNAEKQLDRIYSLHASLTALLSRVNSFQEPLFQSAQMVSNIIVLFELRN